MKGVAGEVSDHDEMLDAHHAREDERRVAMGALGGEAMGSLHGPRDAAASVLEAARCAARGALGGLYERLRGPATPEEARARDSAIEGRTPRHHARGRGSNE